MNLLFASRGERCAHRIKPPPPPLVSTRLPTIFAISINKWKQFSHLPTFSWPHFSFFSTQILQSLLCMPKYSINLNHAWVNVDNKLKISIPKFKKKCSQFFFQRIKTKIWMSVKKMCSPCDVNENICVCKTKMDDHQNAVKIPNLQKHVTVSSTSNGNIIWPLAVRSCRPIDEYRTLDNAFDAAPLPALPTIVFSHITADDFSEFLLFRALHHHTSIHFHLVIVYVHEFGFLHSFVRSFVHIRNPQITRSFCNGIICGNMFFCRKIYGWFFSFRFVIRSNRAVFQTCVLFFVFGFFFLVRTAFLAKNSEHNDKK